MNVIGLSEEHEANLRKLATYLKSEHLLAEFDMRKFSDRDRVWDTPETDCGACGCAVGHAPHAGIPKTTAETWSNYSVRVFELGRASEEWAWCFDASWAHVDGTPTGAALRIEHLLDKGLPDDSEEQMDGIAPLCY